MNCPPLSEEVINFMVERICHSDDLISGLLCLIKHEVKNEYLSIDSLKNDLGKSRTLASKIFYLLAGMLLVDYTFDGMPKTYKAILNANGREVVKRLIKDETNPGGVLIITAEGVKKFE